MDERDGCERFEAVKKLASRIVHLHYCENDDEGVIAFLAPQCSWIGTGEQQHGFGRDEVVTFFRRFNGAIPKCSIRDERYHVIEASPGTYICSGMMWVATEPGTEMYFKMRQRVTFVFSAHEGKLLCNHIHCSNPHLELIGDELFPDKIGRQSYEYVKERIAALEEEAAQRNRQLEVIMASIPGGLKISRDDEGYSFAYVSEDAAALFGYTVEEFMQMSGGSAVGATYPPDMERCKRDCEACFRDGGLNYTLKYRVRCKDGSLKWILDSGKKSFNDKGEVQINSLYLDITKSEEDAQEIRRHQELLQSIYDTVPCGILRFTRKRDAYRIISLNRAAFELFAYDSEEEFFADWHQGVAGTVLCEDRYLMQYSLARLNAPGDSDSVLYRICRSGEIRWLRSTSMIVSSNGDESVIQQIVFDNTLNKRLQEQLEQEQQMYRVAMESSSDILYEYRMDEDVFVYYKPYSSADGQDNIIRVVISHYRQALHTDKVVHPDDISAMIDNICEGRTEMFEARIAPPSKKEYQWYIVTGKTLVSADGKKRVVGTMRNIHDEKKALSDNALELHMNQSALQAISGSYTSIYYLDLPADEYYAVRLPALGSSMRIPRSGSFTKELGQNIQDYVGEEDRDRMQQFCRPQSIMQRLRQVGDCMETEFIRRSSQGGRSWLRLEFQLISVENDRPKNAIATFRNVTRDRMRELERRKEEEKAKRALEEAYAAANRASQAKSDFLSRMSHDIRTPMNAIMGMSAIAEQNLQNPDKLQECMRKIQISGRHLLNLINEVLDMSRIESGNVVLNEAPFDIYRIISDMESVIRPELDARMQHFEISIDPLIHETVVGDSARIQQILLNLLSNAVKYTHKGGHVSLRVREGDAPVNGVGCFEFIVEDNGIGMSEEFQKRLFRPFERAVDSRVDKIQGTGLGLAITKNLVQMMNGSIEVKSHLNEGSRFTVTLCLKLHRRGDEGIECRPIAPPSVPAFTQAWRILLVEDNDLNREIAKELLEGAGLIVDEAENGEQAVLRFEQSCPGYYRLILMDIQMPVMDGYDATRAIRALDRSDAAQIPIVALTANAFAEDVCRTRLAGMNEHIAKPLEVGTLMRALVHWLE